MTLTTRDLKTIEDNVLDEIDFIDRRCGVSGEDFKRDLGRSVGKLISLAESLIEMQLQTNRSARVSDLIVDVPRAVVGGQFYTYLRDGRALDTIDVADEEMFKKEARYLEDMIADANEQNRGRGRDSRDSRDRNYRDSRSGSEGSGDRFRSRQQSSRREPNPTRTAAPSQPGANRVRDAFKSRREEDDSRQRTSHQPNNSRGREEDRSPRGVPREDIVGDAFEIIIDNGITVTADNISVVSTKVPAPVYIMGEQKTIFNEKKLEVALLEGEDMDYNRHRTDRLLTTRIAGKPSVNQTGSALEESLDACRRKVAAWTTVTDDNTDEVSVNPVEANMSVTFTDKLSYYGLPSDYPTIRETLREQGLVSAPNMLAYAYVVDVCAIVHHPITVDVVERLKAASEYKQVKELVTLLIDLKADVHPEAWLSMHDRLTRGIQELFLTTMGISMTLGSIVLDWAALVEYLTSLNDQVTVSMFNKMVPWLVKLAFDYVEPEGEVGEYYLAMDERVLFLPITSDDLAFACARKYGVVSESSNSKLFKLIKELGPELDRKTSIVTLDSRRLGVLATPSALDEQFYYLGPKV